jgi:hypothetical protein
MFSCPNCELWADSWIIAVELNCIAGMEGKGCVMQIADLNFLVAEDDPLQSWALAVMLKKLGAKQITEVSDGVEALAVFQDRTAIYRHRLNRSEYAQYGWHGIDPASGQW